MKKALMFILLYYFCNVNVFSSEEIYSWVGDWKSNQQEIKSLLSNIPFHSEYLDGEIKINDYPHVVRLYVLDLKSVL